MPAPALRSLPALLLLAGAAPLTAEVSFPDQIEPILRSRCLDCHSHASGKMKGGLTLDSRSGWEQGGDSGPAIVPGKPDDSLLVRMIRWSDDDHQMPPKEKLPDAEIALLEEWIRSGAPDPRSPAAAPTAASPWWSLQPLSRPNPPAPGHPIDAFILATLQAKGLTPSPKADPRTLSRRLHFDLTGLPPDADDANASPADNPAAWEALVDRLLASPRHGERWARHWLDVIHFADSHGFEHDVKRENAWRFRDYVIAAFNSDTPYPRFIREQLAADVCFPDESHLTAALGFLGAGTYDISAAGTAVTSFEYLDRDDLVTQTMSACVSTTTNCARCHAHKFDPITQEDYFAIQAVFAGIGKGDIDFDPDPNVCRQRRLWSSLRDAAARRDAAILTAPEHAATIAAWESARSPATPWTTLQPEVFSAGDGISLEKLEDGSLLASGALPDKDVTSVTTPPALPRISAFRIDLLPHDSLPARGPGRPPNGNLHLTEFEVRIFRAAATKPEPVPIASAFADFDQQGFGISGAFDGKPESSWAIHPKVGEPHSGVFILTNPISLQPADRITFTLRQSQPGSHLLGRFRLAAGDGPAASLTILPAPVAEALATPAANRSPDQSLTLAAHVLSEQATAALAALPPPVPVWAAAKAARNDRGLITFNEPRTIRVLKRGDLDKPGEEVAPGALSAISNLPARFPLQNPKDEAARRAAFANWIADPANTLTWRSIVNRVWHYHFGRGLSDTPGDFGRMGGIPSHPELLDWLASWFRDDAKGSLKALHRLIVTSATYQQSSASHENAAALDPDNRLLWRMNRSRLDADSFRDAVLAVSNRLDPTIGGPGIELFSKSPGPQATPKLDYLNFDWNSQGAGRRSIYRVVWRGIADPFMDVLDFPELGLPAPVRGFSASALQSLALFNNQFVLHHSDRLAERAASPNPDPAAQSRALFHHALQRDPSPEELSAFSSLISSHGPAAAARVLLNSNDFLFID